VVGVLLLARFDRRLDDRAAPLFQAEEVALSA
jgi:hypothetical protein